MVELIKSLVRASWARAFLAGSTLTLAGLIVFAQLGITFAAFYGFSRLAVDSSAPFLVASQYKGRVVGKGSIPPEVYARLSSHTELIEVEGLPSGAIELSKPQSGSPITFTARPISTEQGSLSAPKAILAPELDLLKMPMSVILPKRMAIRYKIKVGEKLASSAGNVTVVGIVDFGDDLSQPVVSRETYFQVRDYLQALPRKKIESYRIVFLRPVKGSGAETVASLNQALGDLENARIFTPTEFDREVRKQEIADEDQLRAFLATGVLVVLVLILIISQTFSSLMLSYSGQFSGLLALGVKPSVIVSIILIFGVTLVAFATLVAVLLSGVQRELFFWLELPIVFLPEFVLVVAGLLLASVLIATVISLLSTTKLDPVDLLR
jgi:ABC-type antimicrobial peptide transport system permease subunit